VAFSTTDLPALYSVVVTGFSQNCFATVTGRSHTGFNVVLSPTGTGVTLASGTFDCLVVA
jgi:hypothetical protein